MKPFLALIPLVAATLSTFGAEPGQPSEGTGGVGVVGVVGGVGDASAGPSTTRERSTPNQLSAYTAEEFFALRRRALEDDNVSGLSLQKLETLAAAIKRDFSKGHVKALADIKKKLSMQAEEADALEPLLKRVASLRMARAMVDGLATGTLTASDFPDSSIDPTVLEIISAEKELRTLVKNQQANRTEWNSAIDKVRKARKNFDTVLAKAQTDLRKVLTPKQEAILVDHTILD